MRIIITGGSGFIGKFVVEALSIEHKLLVLGRSESKSHVSYQDYQASYSNTDYSEESLTKIFHEFCPDALIHLAAPRLNRFDNSFKLYLSFLSVTYNLFKVCSDFNLKNIILVSSISVYSTKNVLPWNESESLCPANIYGLSKVLVEDIASYYCFKSLNIKTLRLAQVIGVGERPGYILQVFLNNAIQGLPLTVTGNNSGRRHYVYVKDVVEAVRVSLHKYEISGQFNIGMYTNYSFIEVAMTINNVFGNLKGVEILSGLIADEDIYLMDVSKSKDMLGWSPSYDLLATYQDIKHDLKI